jgi:hypothetical protein
MHDDRAITPQPGDELAVGATKKVSVTALDYTQLRLLAECAVGITDEAANFYFTQKPEPELKLSAKGLDSLDADEVVIPALDDEKYPKNGVTLKAGDKPLVHDDPAPAAGVADAIFWSDAAVQKFVFPYVASCAGTGAATMLQQVQQAWNGYPTDKVVVYALVHVNRLQPQVALELQKVFWVVYELVQDGKPVPGLIMDSLDVFTNKFGSPTDELVPPPPPSDRAVDYHRGAGGTPQRPDYVTLRALAEWACSMRDKPVYFRFKAGDTGFTGPHEHLPHVHPGDIVVPVMTPTVPAGRRQLEGVWFQPEGSDTPSNLAQKGDALFWSTGAIEQFLYPYYASKGGLESLKSLVRMAYVWTGQKPTVEALEGPANFEDEVLQAEDEETGDRVFALIHLYTSEWVEETSQPEGSQVAQLYTRVDPERDLGTVAGDGSVTRLHEAIKGRRAQPA